MSNQPSYCISCRRRIKLHKTAMCKKCRRNGNLDAEMEFVTQQELEVNEELWH
jgi:hypothetical protein